MIVNSPTQPGGVALPKGKLSDIHVRQRVLAFEGLLLFYTIVVILVYQDGSPSAEARKLGYLSLYRYQELGVPGLLVVSLGT